MQTKKRPSTLDKFVLNGVEKWGLNFLYFLPWYPLVSIFTNRNVISIDTFGFLLLNRAIYVLNSFFRVNLQSVHGSRYSFNKSLLHICYIRGGTLDFSKPHLVSRMTKGHQVRLSLSTFLRSVSRGCGEPRSTRGMLWVPRSHYRSFVTAGLRKGKETSRCVSLSAVSQLSSDPHRRLIHLWLMCVNDIVGDSRPRSNAEGP